MKKHFCINWNDDEFRRIFSVCVCSVKCERCIDRQIGNEWMRLTQQQDKRTFHLWHIHSKVYDSGLAPSIKSNENFSSWWEIEALSWTNCKQTFVFYILRLRTVCVCVFVRDLLSHLSLANNFAGTEKSTPLAIYCYSSRKWFSQWENANEWEKTVAQIESERWRKVRSFFFFSTSSHIRRFNGMPESENHQQIFRCTKQNNWFEWPTMLSKWFRTKNVSNRKTTFILRSRLIKTFFQFQAPTFSQHKLIFNDCFRSISFSCSQNCYNVFTVRRSIYHFVWVISNLISFQSLIKRNPARIRSNEWIQMPQTEHHVSNSHSEKND